VTAVASIALAEPGPAVHRWSMPRAVPALALAVLAACGGGGDDGPAAGDADASVDENGQTLAMTGAGAAFLADEVIVARTDSGALRIRGADGDRLVMLDEVAFDGAATDPELTFEMSYVRVMRGQWAADCAFGSGLEVTDARFEATFTCTLAPQLATPPPDLTIEATLSLELGRIPAE
jgi:hypothetical protein